MRSWRRYSSTHCLQVAQWVSGIPDRERSSESEPYREDPCRYGRSLIGRTKGQRSLLTVRDVSRRTIAVVPIPVEPVGVVACPETREDLSVLATKARREVSVAKRTERVVALAIATLEIVAVLVEAVRVERVRAVQIARLVETCEGSDM